MICALAAYSVEKGTSLLFCRRILLEAKGVNMWDSKADLSELDGEREWGLDFPDILFLCFYLFVLFFFPLTNTFLLEACFSFIYLKVIRPKVLQN